MPRYVWLRVPRLSLLRQRVLTPRLGPYDVGCDNPRDYSSMLARFTNRVLSSTILGGFEPRPLIELFQLLMMPRIAPLRYSRSGVSSRSLQRSSGDSHPVPIHSLLDPPRIIPSGSSSVLLYRLRLVLPLVAIDLLYVWL